MKFKNLFLSVLVVLAAACSPKTKTPTAIKVNVPERPAGQEDVIDLATPPIDTVRVGIVGLGMRGSSTVYRYLFIPGAKIVALCDVEPDRVEAAQKTLDALHVPRAAEYSGDTTAYKKLCERDDINLVYICTDWKHHVEIALYAMEHGKNVAIEVPAATSLDEIWALVNMSEKTRLHCMMMENCCYDFFEMSCLAMAQKGLFGEVLHVEGGYQHNLDIYWDQYWHNWRLDFNRTHKGDVYPTHGFGPICQVLNIHRGDRLKTLVAVETKAVNGPLKVEKKTGKPCDSFLNGDETNTLITTENGKTILLSHGVMTPRPYSRIYQIVGTEGFAQKYPTYQLCFRRSTVEGPGAVGEYGVDDEVELTPEQINEYMEKYPSPILTPELKALAEKVGGHGGMDFIMDYRLVYCLRNGLPLDMDVYDLAEWCCVGPLGAISIENGNVPVEVPDFTRGGWQKTNGFHYAFAKE